MADEKVESRTCKTDGKVARKARQRMGMSQSVAAEAWEISERVIRDIETGKGASATKIKVFATKCGLVDWHDLLAAEEIIRLGIDSSTTATAPPESKPEQDAPLEKERKLAAMRDWLLFDFLESIHQVELWKANGHKYPLVAWPVSPSTETHGMSLLEFAGRPQELSGPFAPGVHDAALIRKRQKQKRGMVNDPTYCLRHLDPTGPRIIGGLIGKYFDAVGTCDSLEEELLLAWGEHAPKRPDWSHFLQTHLLRRDALLKFCRSKSTHAHLDGSGRSAAIAIATLTVFRVREKKAGRDEFRAFVRARSSWVANHPNMLHVVPSGMFQPTQDWDLFDPSASDECRAEWDLRHNIYREFVEEVFDCNPDEHRGIDRRSFYRLPDVAHIQRLMESSVPGAEILVPAIIVNMLNLRPEVCTVMLIHDPKWYDDHVVGNEGVSNFKFNVEFMTDAELKAAQQRRLSMIKIWDRGRKIGASELIATYLEGDASPSQFVPPGAAALFLGLEAAHARIESLQREGRLE